MTPVEPVDVPAPSPSTAAPAGHRIGDTAIDAGTKTSPVLDFSQAAPDLDGAWLSAGIAETITSDLRLHANTGRAAALMRAGRTDEAVASYRVVSLSR